MVSQNYAVDKDQKDNISEEQNTNLNITYRNSNNTFQPPLDNTRCCSTFTGNVVHQGRFQYLGDRPLEITHSLKGYGNRGTSSDVIFRSTTSSSDWWNRNKKGWKYFRWISIFSAILLVLGLIIYVLVIDLQVSPPRVSIKETEFDATLHREDAVSLDGDVILDFGGVTYREGNHATSGLPTSATEERNATTGHEFIEIVAAPDLTKPTTYDTSRKESETQNNTTHIENSSENHENNSQNSSEDLQRKESQNVRNSNNRVPNQDPSDEIMMTSDRDIANRLTGGHRHYQPTNAHSRLPVHPTIPSIILKKTKELLGDPFAPVNETESTCFSTRLEICKGVLPYDLTTLPSVPGINRLSDLDAALPYFEMILQSECSQRARQYVCSVLEPACQPMGNNILPPCRKACKAVAEECSDFMLATLDLSKVFHCDLYPDLDDASECVNLAKGEVCFGDEYRCSDGSCIPSRWQCDNVADCVTGDDEVNCTHCHSDEYRCEGDRKCVPLKWQCDGNKDCADGSDEHHCPLIGAVGGFSGQPHTSPCPVGELRCVDGRCITMQQLCDNIHDCSDGADEGNCGPSTILPTSAIP